MPDTSCHKSFAGSTLTISALHTEGSLELTVACQDCRGKSVATTGALFFPAIRMRFAACAIAMLTAAPSFASEYVLKPMQDHGPPSGIQILFKEPTGWRSWGKNDSFMVTFVPNETPTPIPYTAPYLAAELEVTSRMVSDLTVSKDLLRDPRSSTLVAWMHSGTHIELFKTVETFNARDYGTLPIWLVRGRSYSYYLVIIVRQGVRLEVGLRSDNRALGGGKGKPELASGRVLEELKRHKGALKELVRSIEIVKSEGE